jgi:hypothetical protein
MDRALVSGIKGRRFKSGIAHHPILLSNFRFIQGSSMKKWTGPFFSLLLILILALLSSPFDTTKQSMPGKEKKGERAYAVVQTGEREEKKEEVDPHYLLVLKRFQEQLDEWLKSLNERIENQDVTRFEVRFLEILRSILEWVKEKVDAKIESYEQEKPQKKKKGMFQETLEKYSPVSVKG